MKKTLLRALLVALLVGFSLIPLGLNGLGFSPPAIASALFAQTPTPQAAPPISPPPGAPQAPTPGNTPPPQATPSPKPTPAQAEVESSAAKAGPYDMEAIKAFNRALYGS